MNQVLKKFYSLPGVKKSYALKFFVITFLGIHIPLIGLSIFLLVLPNQLDNLTIFWIVLGFTLIGTVVTLFILNYLIKPIQQADRALLQYIQDREVPKISIEGDDELVRLLNSMEKTIQKTEELIEQKDDLIYLLSHDFRAPLIKAKGVFELMREQSGHEIAIELAAKLALEMEDQLGLMESLLVLLQERSPELPPKLNSTDMEGLIKGIISDLQEKSVEKSLQIKLDIQEGSLVPIERDLIRQLIFNLLSNAVKFSRKDGVISIKGVVKNDSFSLQVKDDGIGFDPKFKDQFFQKFTTYRQAGTQGEKSTGLGLYISRKIAERHRAKIKAHSDGKDQGALFEVEFPLN
ncbi:Signal transduction histidine kinase [Belliella buryatensis]|uniref:histidine kinase n=1 Tax=Belliella buryatensis TaxID=1500549 RepID=A0A239CCI1_9BACT|nr:HAMP domain-containing sensor histidine kinase [Belliella buryatensis]SNS17679.1 Signal transduction histidine kinase [Belliella buryatensis]